MTAEVGEIAGRSSNAELEGPAVAATGATAPARVAIRWPILAGTLAAFFLTGLYIGIVGFAQGLNHAIELLVGDWYLVSLVVIGFGAQVTLFVYVRTRLRPRGGMGPTNAVAGAGTGTSTAAMVACCAHHVTDLLPIIGISGAALFLSEYRVLVMMVGIVGNIVGIVLMLRLIRGLSAASAILVAPMPVDRS